VPLRKVARVRLFSGRAERTSRRFVTEALEPGERILVFEAGVRFGTDDKGEAFEDAGSVIVSSRHLHFVNHHLLKVFPMIAHERFAFSDMKDWSRERRGDSEHISFSTTTGRQGFVVSGNLAEVGEAQLGR
jgi:hypothetical protein